MTALILVVDDLEPNVKLLEAKLAAEYYDVVTASDGYKAIEMAKKHTPDLILLDVMMPNMDGFTACRHLKSSPDTAHIPVVMVTALSEPSDRVQGLQSGADDFLTKPINDVQLLARVKSLLRMKQLIDELRLRGQTSSEIGEVTGMNLNELGNVAGSHVLLVDDDVVQGRNIIHRLEMEGLKVSRAETAAEATALGDQIAFDLVIVSTQLMDSDGLRLCSQLRSHETTRHIPQIIMVDEQETKLLVRGLEMGVNDYLIAPVDVSEMACRVRTNIRRKKYQDALKSSYQQTVNMAIKDNLTGIYNRHYLEAHLKNLVSSSLEKTKPLSCLMMDMDYFKSVNDGYGHDVGDEILKELAKRIAAQLRASDMVARFGGEEFIVLLPGAPLEIARDVAERIRLAVQNVPFAITHAAGTLSKTISIGGAMLEQTDGDATKLVEDLIKRADDALYHAKHNGRNRAVIAGLPPEAQPTPGPEPIREGGTVSTPAPQAGEAVTLAEIMPDVSPVSVPPAEAFAPASPPISAPINSDPFTSALISPTPTPPAAEIPATPATAHTPIPFPDHTQPPGFRVEPPPSPVTPSATAPLLAATEMASTDTAPSSFSFTPASAPSPEAFATPAADAPAFAKHTPEALSDHASFIPASPSAPDLPQFHDPFSQALATPTSFAPPSPVMDAPPLTAEANHPFGFSTSEAPPPPSANPLAVELPTVEAIPPHASFNRTAAMAEQAEPPSPPAPAVEAQVPVNDPFSSPASITHLSSSPSASDTPFGLAQASPSIIPSVEIHVPPPALEAIPTAVAEPPPIHDPFAAPTPSMGPGFGFASPDAFPTHAEPSQHPATPPETASQHLDSFQSSAPSPVFGFATSDNTASETAAAPNLAFAMPQNEVTAPAETSPPQPATEPPHIQAFSANGDPFASSHAADIPLGITQPTHEPPQSAPSFGFSSAAPFAPQPAEAPHLATDLEPQPQTPPSPMFGEAPTQPFSPQTEGFGSLSHATTPEAPTQPAFLPPTDPANPGTATMLHFGTEASSQSYTQPPEAPPTAMDPFAAALAIPTPSQEAAEPIQPARSFGQKPSIPEPDQNFGTRPASSQPAGTPEKPEAGISGIIGKFLPFLQKKSSKPASDADDDATGSTGSSGNQKPFGQGW